jgi:hypothetical protein
MFGPLAAAVEYGQVLTNSHVVFVVDNEADVHIINRQTSRERRLCGLLRCLCDAALRHNFSFKAVHRPGVDNELMDWASRPDKHVFTSDPSAFKPTPPRTTPTHCACSVSCGVVNFPPLRHPRILTLINSRCLLFARKGSRASWAGSSCGW